MRTIIQTPHAPQAIGPYSQAVRVSNQQFLFLSGQIPLDPTTGQIVAGEIEAQTERVIMNLKEILTAGGSSLEKVVKDDCLLEEHGGLP